VSSSDGPNVEAALVIGIIPALIAGFASGSEAVGLVTGLVTGTIALLTLNKKDK
jgi:hypothetical protein